MPNATVYRTLSFMSVDAHNVSVIVIVNVLGVNGPFRLSLGAYYCRWQILSAVANWLIKLALTLTPSVG